MSNQNRQKGMTFIGWLIVLALVLFFMMLGFRLFPIYYKSYAVDRALAEVADDPALSARNPRELREGLQKRLNINDISVVEASDLEIEDVSEGQRLILAYEERTPFMGNLYLVAEFRMTAIARE